MNDEAERRQRQHQGMRSVKGVVQLAFQKDRKSDAQGEEQDRQVAPAEQGIRDYVNGHKPGDRNKDEAIEHLSRDGMTPSERIHERACKERGNAEDQEHRRVA